MKRALLILLLVGVIGAGAGAIYMRRGGPAITVNTSPVTQGEIVDTVGATGTLQAVTTVQVGSQVSGTILSLGADFNSIVHKGQIIAQLDPSLLQAQVKQAEANLERSQADLDRNRVELVDAQTKYKRAQELATKSLLPLSELDAAKIAVDSAQAQVKSAEASVVQARASLNQNQVNVDHTTINSPIDGIVIQRSVDVGQTVAASLQSPTLFSIAADLTKMQVNANIDESDIGRIRPGQISTFRVDAYPGEQFEGTVEQVRLQPVDLSNVTTYATIINVPNPGMKLKPGMTANLRVQIARRDNVLRVPNAAIRFRPTTDMFTALNQTPPPDAQFGGARRGRGGQPATDTEAINQPAAPSAQNGKPAAPLAPGRGPASSSVTQPGTAPGTTADGAGGFARGRGFSSDRSGGASGTGRGSGGGADGGDRTARMLERFKSMSPDEQKQYLSRLKERGADTSALEAAMKPAATGRKSGSGPAAASTGKSATPQSAQTIDSLFAPLPVVESRGRVWLYVDNNDKKELKPVNVRLGITDGTNTELVSGELQPGMQVVTGMLTGSTRPTAAATAGNPLLPQGGRGPGGFGGPGGGFGGRGR
jgi:HlyD family secretion protein